MGFQVKEIIEPSDKSCLCNIILRQLPDWFGIEEAIEEYVKKAERQLVFALYDETNPKDEAIGFVAVERHFPQTAEVYVMGILPAFHRKGGGALLLQAVEERLTSEGVRFLTVKTLSPSRESAEYEKTRLFYEGRGFSPLEEFKTLWGESNPCLFLVKHLGVR